VFAHRFSREEFQKKMRRYLNDIKLG